MTAIPQEQAPETSDRFRHVIDTCTPYVVGVFDLSGRGGPEHTVVVKARSAAHLRKLAARLADYLSIPPEGDAPDGSEPWLVVDGGNVVVHLLTGPALERYGLVDLFARRSETPGDVFALALMERLEGRRRSA